MRAMDVFCFDRADHARTLTASVVETESGIGIAATVRGEERALTLLPDHPLYPYLADLLADLAADEAATPPRSATA